MKTSSKNYKRTLATEQNLFKLSKIEQLPKIKTSELRKFWKILNGNKKNTSNISVEKCFDFFKDISSSQHEENLRQNIPENNADDIENIN